MTTTTTRYGFNKIVLASDVVDVVNDFNVNWDAIDLKLGSQVCTSSTRPSSPTTGQVAFETDTGYVRKWDGTGWTTVGNANSASSALPANVIGGELNYLTDIGAIAYYSGGAWHIATPVNCTSGSRPTGSALQSGAVIYETDTKRLLVYNGSSWENKAFANFVCTSGTHPSSPFQGLEIYETDTGLSAVYSGSNYSYGVQQIAPTQTLGSTTASVTFSGLPSGVNAFLLRWSARCSDANAAEQLKLQLNGASGSSYIWEVNQANNATVAGTTSAGASTFIQAGTVCAASATANYWSSGEIFIDNGSASKFPNVVGKAAAFATTTNMWCGVYSGLYAVAAAVSSVTLFGSTGSFIAGSQFSLYALQ